MLVAEGPALREESFTAAQAIGQLCYAVAGGAAVRPM